MLHDSGSLAGSVVNTHVMFMGNVMNDPTHIFRGAFPATIETYRIFQLDLNWVIFLLRYRTLLRSSLSNHTLKANMSEQLES